MPKSDNKTCPYCSKNFAKGFIQRHIGICNDKQKQDLNGSFTEIDMSIFDEENDEINENEFNGNGFDDDDDFDNFQENNEELTVEEGNEQINELYDQDDDLMDDSDMEDLIANFEPENNVPTEQRNKPKIITWLCLFLAFWQFTFGITDSALEVIIKFLYTFFSIICENSVSLQTLFAAMPASLYLFLKYLNLGSESKKFVKYVICIKCLKLYKYEDCYTMLQGERISKTCNNILFPNHPQRFRRAPCGQKLLMTVKTNNKTFLSPFKTYCYMPLQDSVENLFTRKDVEEGCELWKSRTQNNDIMTDIYDGAVWKENIEVLREKNTYGIAINLDWFQPFTHVKSYSVGVLYAVLLNLPRNERFKRKNVILIGVIPNMKKEPETNTFVAPFIDDLLESWNGNMKIKTSSSRGIEVPVKLMLLLVGCDIPACRKLCGFLGMYHVCFLFVKRI